MSLPAKKKGVTAERFSFGSKSFDPEEYAKTTRMARLEAIQLIESRYSAIPEEMLGSNGSDRKLTQGFGGEPRGHHFDQENGVVIGGYRWTAEVKDKRKKVLSIRTEYMIAYSGLTEAKPEYIELYFNKVARFATYPFFRAHVAMHTASSGLVLPPLPSLFERVD